MLERLTSLRAFAALAVFVFHLGAWGVAALPLHLAELGYVGVAFFFVLSGFVLAWGTSPDTRARTFYRRRFARVWPSHVVMLAVAALVPVVSVARSWEIAVPNVVLLQAWFVGNGEVVYGMNGPSWSLSCEAFFYATFPLAVLALRRLPRWAGWSFAVAALLVCSAAGIVSPGAAVHVPVTRYGEFLLGLVAGLAVRDGWRPRVPLPAALGAVLVAGVLSYRLPEPLPNTVMALPFLLVILWASGRDLEGRHGWLSARWMVLAGEISFAFYLVHEVLLVNLRTHLHQAPVVNALIVLGIAVAGAVLLHFLVERPLNRRLRGRPHRAAAAPAPAVFPEGATVRERLA